MEFRYLAVIIAASTVSFAQSEPNQEIYTKIVLACEENKAIKTSLAQMLKKNEKATDAYDKSEHGEKAKYERNASEIDIVQTEGPKVVKSYADCMKTKLQQGKEFRNQGYKLNVNISVTNDGRIVNNKTTTSEFSIKKGKKATVTAPKTTFGKSFWCEDEVNKCFQATIIIEQK